MSENNRRENMNDIEWDDVMDDVIWDDDEGRKKSSFDPGSTLIYWITATSYKKNKLILTLLNLALIAPFIVRHLSIAFGLVVFVALLIQVTGIILKSNEQLCATAFLPVFIFFDVVIFAAGLLEPNFRAGILLPGGFAIHSGAWVIPALIGVVLFLFKGWLGDLGGTLLSLSVAFALWGDGSIINPELTPEAKTLLLGTLIVNLIWFILKMFSRTNGNEKEKMNRRLGMLVFVLGAVFCVLFQNFIYVRAGQIGRWMNSFSSVVLPWWKTILLTVVLQLLAFAMYNFDDDCMTADAAVCSAIAWSIVLVKVILSNYFPYSWLVLAVYFVVSFVVLFTLKADGQVMGLREYMLYPALFIVLLLSVAFIRAGLLLNVIFGLFFVLAFYNACRKNGNEKNRTLRWILVLCCIVAGGITFVWLKRYIAANVIMLLAEFVVAAAAVIIVNMRYKAEGEAYSGASVFICIVLALLTLLTVGPKGTRIKFSPDDDGSALTVEITSRGRKNEISSVEYTWDAGVFQGGEESEQLQGDGSEQSFSLEVLGKSLSVTAVDANGIRTSKSYWLPLWKEEWLCLGQPEPEVEPEPEIPTWRQAYMDYLDHYASRRTARVSLLYVDDDAIPELWITTANSDAGGILCVYRDGEVAEYDLEGSAVSYISKANLILASTWQEIYDEEEDEEYITVTDTVYELHPKSLSAICSGEYQRDIETTDIVDGTFYFAGEPVSSVEEYDTLLGDHFYSFGYAIDLNEGENYYSVEDLRTILFDAEDTEDAE